MIRRVASLVGLVSLATFAGCTNDPSEESPSPGEVVDAPVGTVAAIVPGTLAGSFKATAQGSATYTVAIQTPAGTAGMQPGLSLSYSSGAGANLLGHGWSLGGLSAITRCAKTIAQDGAAGRIAYDANDRFCLDGVRLVEIGAGASYWEYRTEVEGFSRIRAYGSSTSAARNVKHNPDYWEVLTKTGQRLLFGNTDNARIEATGRTDVRAYALSRAEDKNGNYLAVTYTEDTVSGEYLPARIDYTGNAAAGLTPNESVTFTYEDRPDKRRGYLAGDIVSSTKRMTRITTRVGATVVRDYRIGYAAGAMGRSLVAELQECGGDNVCYAPTQFTYAAGTDGLLPAQNWGAGHTASERAGDFDGDGVTDLFDIRNGTVFVSLSKRTQFAPATPWVTGVGSSQNVQPLDLDGDAKSDLLEFDTAGNARAWLSTGTAFKAAVPWGSGLNADAARTLLADTNGDGRADVLRFDAGGQIMVGLGTATGFSALTPWVTGTEGVMARLRVGDFDGDGRSDVLALNSNDQIQVWLSEGNKFRAAEPWGSGHGGAFDEFKSADFNGDGRDDLVRLTSDGTALLRLSTGRGFLAPESWGTGLGKDSGVADLNGDGLADIARMEKSGDVQVTILTAHNTGRGFDSLGAWGQLDPKTVTRMNPWGTGTVCGQLAADIYCHNKGYVAATQGGWGCSGKFATYADCYRVGEMGMQLGDFNGDGRVDAVLLKSADGVAAVAPSESNTTDMLVAVANGLGHRVEIEYAPLTSGEVYARATATYPDRPLVGGMQVVRKVNESNAVSGMRSTWFSYAGAKFNVIGRGFLGFTTYSQWTPNADGSGVLTETTYSSTFPYTGNPTRQLKSVLTTAGALMEVSRTENSYSYIPFATPGQPKRYYVYTSQTGTSGKDLDGTALPSSTTVSQYDSDGNLTSSTVRSGAVTTTTTNTYLPADTGRWILGRLSRSTVAKSDGVVTQVRTSAFEYTPATGQLTKEIIEPDTAALRMETAYTYDIYGNRTGSTMSAAGVAARTSSKTYDARGRLVIADKNAAGHESKFEYAQVHMGAPTKVTDANGLVTSRSYDSLGRLAKETRPDGVATTYAYEKLSGVTRYDHPSKVCSNGVDTCSTPARAQTDGPLATTPSGAASNGCSLGYWRGAVDCNGNAVNGVCPKNVTRVGSLGGGKIILTAPVRGSFDFAEGAVYNVHESGLLCYPANVPVPSLGAVMAVKTTRAGAPVAKAYVDVLGREIKREVEGFDGRLVIEETVYDADGRLARKSLPYYAGETAYWSTTRYDALGRAVETVMPNGASTQTRFSGLQETLTNAKGQVTVRIKNAQGLVVRVTDAKSGIVTYKYNPFGDLVETKDAGGNVTTIDYDVRGRRVSLSDPDMGLTTYTYNGFGEVVREQTENLRAANKATVMSYDALGRMVSRDEAGALSAWTYDTCVGGRGKTCRATSPGYARVLTYDALGRNTVEAITVGNASYSTQTTYDAMSRVDTVTYPSGIKVRSHYNARGFLDRVEDPGGVVYWQANTVTAQGQITQETYGNGVITARTLAPDTGLLQRVTAGKAGAPTAVQDASYEYDVLGNTTLRADARTGLRESFGYDTLNRLVSVTPLAYTGTAPVKMTLAYDAAGNITAKSDVGAYSYIGAGAHAVTTAGSKTYEYDTNGNMTTGDGRTLTWTPFNMPLRISNATGAFAEFTYGPERQRIKQVSNTATTVYVNKLFERVTKGAVVEDRHFVFAGETLVAQVTKVGAAAATLSYFHHDHLGSISVITDATGGVVERLAYDAFGKRRNADGSAMSVVTLKAPVNRGYTGHEMLDALGLVHMNARMYDPVLGRFLSPDTHVQAPEFSQSFNRYSYVVNNPLSLTDPSGHFFGFFAALFAIVSAVVAAIAAAIAAIVAAIAAAISAIAGAIAGLMSVGLFKAMLIGGLLGLVTGGSIKSMLMGAFTAAIFFGVGTFTAGNFALNVIAHGVTGGFLSVAQGGDFLSGFVSSAFSAFCSPFVGGMTATITANETLRTCVGALSSAVIGGVSSTLGGGKFENGAMTAAFGYLFNHNMHEERRDLACYEDDVKRQELGERLASARANAPDLRQWGKNPGDSAEVGPRGVEPVYIVEEMALGARAGMVIGNLINRAAVALGFRAEETFAYHYVYNGTEKQVASIMDRGLLPGVRTGHGSSSEVWLSEYVQPDAIRFGDPVFRVPASELKIYGFTRQAHQGNGFVWIGKHVPPGTVRAWNP